MAMVDIRWMQGSGSTIANYCMAADYVFEQGGESQWRGEHRHKLGFDGKVTLSDLKAALNNRDAFGGKVTSRDAKDRRSCLHIVVSEPKGVTEMALLAGDSRIEEAHKRSIQIMMDAMAEDVCRRVRKDGQDTNVRTGNFVYAMFTQHTTRPEKPQGSLKQQLLSSTSLSTPDPQLHTHIVVPNFTYDEKEKKWYAIDGEQIKNNAHYWNLFYRATMAKQLEMLGYQLDYENGNYDIHGITKAMKDKFSNRTFAILDEIEKRGITRADTKAQVGPMTRKDKDTHFTEEQLQQIWIARLTPQELQTIRDIYARSLGYGFAMSPDFSDKYTDQALDKLTHQTTWVTERAVMTEALKTGLGKVSVEGIQNHIENRINSSGVCRRKRDRPEVTTEKARLKQIQVADLWKAGMGKYEKLGRDTYTVKDPPHIKALKKLAGIRDQYGSVRGNHFLKDAQARAQADLGAGPVTDINNPPEESIWFVDKIADGDLPELMQKAVERDARIVFWGKLQRSDLENQLRIPVVELFDREPPTLTTRLKTTILNLIQRGIYGTEIDSYREDNRQPIREPQRTR